MSRINIIVAVTNNMVIGKNNDLPWQLPSDLKNFKKITNGATVIMGRKCWESIPEKFRPLPNRLNIVITRNESYVADGAATLSDLTGLLNRLRENDEDDDVFVIGGSDIYKDSFKLADKLYLTKIDAEVEGDVFLQGLDFNEWVLIDSSDQIYENGFNYKFEIYTKKING